MKTEITAVIILVVSVLIGASPFIIEETSVEKREQRIDSSVTVIDNDDTNLTDLGVNADPSLEFGEVVNGTGFTKWIQISVQDKSEVRLSSTGNITRLLEHEKRLYVNGSERMPVKVKSVSPGYYSGSLELVILSPTNRLGSLYIDARQKLYQMKLFKPA